MRENDDQSMAGSECYEFGDPRRSTAETQAQPSLVFLVTSHSTAIAFLSGYLKQLHELGWQVALICSPGDGLSTFSITEGIPIHTVPMRRNPSPLRDAYALLKLTMLLRRLRPDVVVYATPKASLLGAIAAALSGVRTRIYELWGLRLETSYGILRKILVAMESLTARLSTGIVANSESLALRSVELGVTAGKTPAVLGAGSSHGVDAHHFSPTSTLGSVNEATRYFLNNTAGMTVGFIGRLHPDKGIDTLLEALDKCAANGVKVRGMLVGRSEGFDAASYMNENFGAPIHLVGQEEDVRPYLAEIDVLVLMSLREGFPNVVLEAAAMGVPAIVADTTGTIDSVINDVTGFIVRSGDVGELANRICELESSSARREEMGKAARAWVVTEFPQDHVRRLHSQYFADLNRRSGVRP